MDGHRLADEIGERLAIEASEFYQFYGVNSPFS